MIAIGAVADPGDRVPSRFHGKAVAERLRFNDGNAVMHTFPTADEIRVAPLDLEDGYPVVTDQAGINVNIEESAVEG